MPPCGRVVGLAQDPPLPAIPISTVRDRVKEKKVSFINENTGTYRTKKHSEAG
jgi:hypothetical protein